MSRLINEVTVSDQEKAEMAGDLEEIVEEGQDGED